MNVSTVKVRYGLTKTRLGLPPPYDKIYMYEFYNFQGSLGIMALDHEAVANQGTGSHKTSDNYCSTFTGYVSKPLQFF